MSPNKIPTKKYKYTCGNAILTEEQREFYEEKGYLVFRKLVNDDLLEECHKQFVGICNKTEKTEGFILNDNSLKKAGAKGEFLIHKIQDFMYDEVFFKYASNKAIVDIVSDIIGPNITVAHSMLINKPPNAAVGFSKHPIHQDLHFFSFRPAEKIVGCWTAMETANEINGCLFVLPGTHKGDLHPHQQEPESADLFQSVPGFDLVPTINLIMQKGDTLFFNPLLLHGSGPNLSQGFRKAISCHYADNNCSFIDVKGTRQEIFVREIDKMLATRGAVINYIDLWKLRSRFLQGIPGNFQTATSKL